jgi:peptidylprolyl isomerase
MATFVSCPPVVLRRLALLFACLLLAGFAVACGDEEQPEEQAAATPEATATAEPTEFDAKAVGKDLDAKPQIPPPSGDPPAELQKTDVVRGKGKRAKAGDIVDVQYVGVSWSTGQQFDASWDRGGEPFQFPLGGGQVIPGWDQGVEGMRVGGRRTLVIPPDLAYGDNPPSPDIAPGETLVFVVDMKKIA